MIEVMSKPNLLPCPFCGSDNILFTSTHVSGHGDSGYTNARYVCEDCIATKGQSDYGMYSYAVQEAAANAWNTRGGIPGVPVKIPVPEPTKDEKLMMELKERYKNVSIFEFMELFTLKS